MPKLSDTMTEGTLVHWKKKLGDTVSMGEVIAEVETDKATMEMEAFEDGVITKLYVNEGQKVQVGEKIARIGEESSTAPTEKKPAAPSATAEPEMFHVEQNKKEVAPSQKEKEPTQRVKASPLARKVAKEHNIDLSTIEGSGPNQRIVQKDVLVALQSAANHHLLSRVSPTEEKQKPSQPAAPAPALSDKQVALSSMRKAIADRLLESKTKLPHFYLHVEVDAEPLMRLRKEINIGSEQEGIKYSVNDLVLKAAVMALTRVPKVNSSFQGDHILHFGDVHLSVAVAIDEGLITPVIRNAQKKSLKEISQEVKDLALRARSKKLKPEEYQGGTFTVSNLGSYGIDRFDAIINPPQAAILSVGAIVKKPVVNSQNEIVVGYRLDLGLSCDHRVVDGAIGADYLAALRRLIEHPAIMLL